MRKGWANLKPIKQRRGATAAATVHLKSQMILRKSASRRVGFSGSHESVSNSINSNHPSTFVTVPLLIAAGIERLSQKFLIQGIEIIEGELASEATHEKPVEPPVGTLTEDPGKNFRRNTAVLRA